MEKTIIVEQPTNICLLGEDEACRYLKKQGYKIVERNYRVPAGEIDIIARRKDLIVFVEVKTRCSDRYAPWEAVGYRKRRNLRSAARAYIAAKRVSQMEFRFDVISIILDDSLRPQVEWMQGAF